MFLLCVFLLRFPFWNHNEEDSLRYKNTGNIIICQYENSLLIKESMTHHSYIDTVFYELF